ncbi:hypothetical protein TYRP_018420 [Tyrophagus putrescentiae]|nr:hypothetical protein TYRP_018420 [Tyrophagus putrescentiae]
MSDINSETTTTPKNADTAASNSSNAQSGTATTVHRSPQKSRQNHNHNHNHNTNHHGNHNSKNVNNNIGWWRPGYPKRTRRKDDDDDPFEPPTVFKLGGNIHDPLNLNGIGANPGQTTPISSPFPSPFPLPADKSSSRENASKEKVEVLIPPNICDPLNLSCPNALNESDLISPTNFKSSNTQLRQTAQQQQQQQQQTSSHLFGDGVFHKHPHSSSEKPAPKNNKERFRFGNYNRYYGYRNSQHCDRRLELLPRDLIQGKDVLDVGCNIGHVTLTLARDYGPRRIVGVDIDPGLIEVAKKNVRHYITEAVVQREGMPLSMPLLYGPLANMPKQQGEEKEESGGFPNNVFFFALNYVPESDALLEVQEEEYDAIICLSLTKWIHLNWGDAGIRRLFQRAFRALRPGGCLILEPQPWSSYQKKAKLTPQIQSTYRSIRFRPEQFNEYLLKDVGFKSCELLGTPQNTSKGFQRPIYLYKKPAAPLKSATATVSASASASATESPAPASSSSS